MYWPLGVRSYNARHKVVKLELIGVKCYRFMVIMITFYWDLRLYEWLIWVSGNNL